MGRNPTHGLSNSKEYQAWSRMRACCKNPRVKSYAAYGGRGIKLCKEWNDFGNFYMQMGPMPQDCTGIELVNMDADFSMHNCVWSNKDRRKPLSEMPGNKNRPSKTKIDDPVAVTILIQREHKEKLAMIAKRRSLKDTAVVTVGDLVREAIHEMFPLETKDLFK